MLRDPTEFSVFDRSSAGTQILAERSDEPGAEQISADPIEDDYGRPESPGRLDDSLYHPDRPVTNQLTWDPAPPPRT